MSNKNSRAGGKFNNNHTTLIPAASTVADIANKCHTVYSISPGYVKAGLKPVNGQRRVKILDEGTCILLKIRDNTSHQELHVYAHNKQEAMLAIARGARDANLNISFGNKT